jgi:hypothetical protein
VSKLGKLQPLAKDQILIFRRRAEEGGGQAITVRASADFLGRLAHLADLARENGLAYVTAELAATEHAWSIGSVYMPGTSGQSRVQLCVSPHELWLLCVVRNDWTTHRFETKPFMLNDICPIELMPRNPARLPGRIGRTWLRPYADRCRALMQARAIYDALYSAAIDMERSMPNERLALFDHLWFSRNDARSLASVRQAWRRVDADLERWEQELEAEMASLCQDVLGVTVGDIIVVEQRGRPVRIAVEGMSTLASDKEVTFLLWGKRFRKDGLPGNETIISASLWRMIARIERRKGH